jgi:ABC-type protease/lipase transport system fused ATPase/permease subunit
MSFQEVVMPALPSIPRSVQLRQQLTRHAGPFAIFSLALTALLLAPTLYMLQVYDRVLTTRNETTLVVLTLLVLGVYGLTVALEAVRAAVSARLTAQADAALAPVVFEASLQPRPEASALLLASDLGVLRQALAGPLPALAFDLPLGAVFLLVAGLIDVWLGTFIAASVALLVGLALWQEQRLREPTRLAQLQSTKAQQALQEAARQAETVRALSMADRVGQRWLQLHQAASARQLGTSAEAGAHFGHKTSRWHPKMAQYIHSKRGDNHIIDLNQTVAAYERALDFANSVAAKGSQVLFVSTKRCFERTQFFITRSKHSHFT